MKSRQSISNSTMRGSSYLVSQSIQLQQLFQKNLQKKTVSDEIAITFEDPDNGIIVHLTYATLEAKSNQIARKVTQILDSSNRKQTNNDGDYVIVVCMEPSEKLIITLLAIWKAGAAYLPLDVNTPVNRMEHIFKEVNPLMMIVDRDREITQNVVNYNIFETECSTLSSAPLSLNERLQNDHITPTAIILYTSGSTGTPKGVRLPHNVIMNRLNWQWRTFPFENSENVCVFKTAITFVDAVSEIWAPLLYSDPRTLLIIPKSVTKDPEKLLRILNNYKVERLVLVPSLLLSILMYLDMMKKQSSGENDFLMNLKLWICSGEPLPSVLVQRFFTNFSTGQHRICNFYGSTEIMGDVTYHVMSASQQFHFEDKIPIGIPLDNTELYLLDNRLQLVKQGEIGELFVSGFNLAAGYVAGRDPDKFINNPFTSKIGFSKMYRTGDYAKIVQNVMLYEGRCDSQIKIRGQRVDLSEIQATLNNLHGIQKTAVLCYKPGEINQTIIAFVTVQIGFALSENDIQEELKKHLVPYAIPQVFVIDTIPLLNNGKVDRQTLLKYYANNAEKTNKNSYSKIDYNGIENSKMKAAKCLFETIISVLGNTIRDHLSINANFYEIGGNSLNCIQTITNLRERGYFIGIADFISAPNLGIVLNRMQAEKYAKENIPDALDVKQKNFCKNNYRYEMLRENHKNVVFKIITDSFYEKADLEQWLVPKPKRECYTELLEAIWDPLIAKNLSFVVYSKVNQNCVGACLNFDAYDEPEVDIHSNLSIIFEFLEYLENPVRQKLPIGKGQILHSFMMGTDSSLNAVQNIQVVTCMENENLKIAKRKGFAGVFTTNTNPLTQQLGTNIFKYRTLLDYQVNQYTASDGSKPFALAPNEQRAICSWKPV